MSDVPTSSIDGHVVAVRGTVQLDITPAADDRGAAAPVWELDLVRSGSVTALDELTETLDRVRSGSPAGRVPFRLVADRASDSLDPLAETLADTLGLGHRRELLQMRRPLPVEADDGERVRAPAITTRPIHLGAGGTEPGEGDVAAWLRVNNRAFATHPDQGQETLASLRRRIDVEHEDPSGFLVLDDEARPGELAGFCWTKVHDATDTDPVLGEIYVIGVDPTRHGEGLGTSLVLAGLDHLAGRGVTTGMLYVEADNDPARHLYDRLGFTVHRRRRVYTAAPS